MDIGNPITRTCTVKTSDSMRIRNVHNHPAKFLSWSDSTAQDEREGETGDHASIPVSGLWRGVWSILRGVADGLPGDVQRQFKVTAALLAGDAIHDGDILDDVPAIAGEIHQVQFDERHLHSFPIEPSKKRQTVANHAKNSGRH